MKSNKTQDGSNYNETEINESREHSICVGISGNLKHCFVICFHREKVANTEHTNLANILL